MPDHNSVYYSNPPGTLIRSLLLQWKSCLMRGVSSLEGDNFSSILTSFHLNSGLIRGVVFGGSGITNVYTTTTPSPQMGSTFMNTIFHCTFNGFIICDYFATFQCISVIINRDLRYNDFVNISYWTLSASSSWNLSSCCRTSSSVCTTRATGISSLMVLLLYLFNP